MKDMNSNYPHKIQQFTETERLQAIEEIKKVSSLLYWKKYHLHNIL